MYRSDGQMMKEMFRTTTVLILNAKFQYEMHTQLFSVFFVIILKFLYIDECVWQYQEMRKCGTKFGFSNQLL